MEPAASAQWPLRSSSEGTNPPNPDDAPRAPESADAHPAHGSDPEADRTQKREPPPGSRNYKPRVCRICLEVVQPTTELGGPGAGIFGSGARVKYVSEDAELGRLIRPCKCKGTQKYVHEGCLQAWRKTAPLSDRNYWRCPTCQFQYRIERLTWGHWLSSRWARAALTLLVMLTAVFLLGFVADPIINLWIDPLGSIADTVADVLSDIDALREDTALDEPSSWPYHFLKGLFSLGLLGLFKSILVLSPWQWFNIRHGGLLGGGRRRAGTGRDRLQSINWALVVIGIFTFMGATWKFVSRMSSLVLESVSERVVDVQDDGPDDDDDDGNDASQNEQSGREGPPDRPRESRKGI